jgi:hypothetical protein
MKRLFGLFDLLNSLLDSLAVRYLDWRREQYMIKDGCDPDIVQATNLNYEQTEERATLEADLEGSGVSILVDGLAQFYEKHGGPNYLDMTFYSHDAAYVVTITPKKPGVKTKHEIITGLKDRLETCRQDKEELRAECEYWRDLKRRRDAMG